jgi:hypothetical protein
MLRWEGKTAEETEKQDAARANRAGSVAEARENPREIVPPSDGEGEPPQTART